MLNFNFKNIIYVFVLILAITSFLAPLHTDAACNVSEVEVTLPDGSKKCINNTVKYELLEPIICPPGTAGCSSDGKFSETDFSDTGILGKYLNLMISIFIGLSAVLAVVMIVVGGIEYMSSELISSKEQGKSRMTNALFGLIVALGSYALLYTINPNILKTEINIQEANVTITLDEENFAQTESSIESVGRNFAVDGSPSVGVQNFVATKLSQGQALRAIKVDTANNRAYFYVGPEGDWSQFISVPINKGLAGFSETGQARAGDNKTPKGTTTITGDVRIGSTGNAVTVAGGRFNVGPAFINIGATIDGKNRGIGFHGSANNNLGTTNGCIRMRNDDLLALARYMRPGVKVIIE